MTNVSLFEGLLRFVATLFLAILAVVLNSFIPFVLAMIVLVTAIAQWCPLKQVLGIKDDRF